jgi:hypothetical protein
MGLRPERGWSGDAQQKLKTKDQTSHQQIRNCLKIIKERRRKIGR